MAIHIRGSALLVKDNNVKESKRSPTHPDRAEVGKQKDGVFFF
jgi:hypothetical protein